MAQTMIGPKNMGVQLTNKKIVSLTGISKRPPKSLKTAIFEKLRISENSTGTNKICYSLVIFCPKKYFLVIIQLYFENRSYLIYSKDISNNFKLKIGPSNPAYIQVQIALFDLILKIKVLYYPEDVKMGI